MKRRLAFVLSVATILICGLVLRWWLRQEPEPKYQGKKLSYWLDQVEGPSRAPTWDPRVVLDPQATEVVRQIGTNAIPVLLRKMTVPDSSLRRKVGKFVDTPKLYFLRRFLLPPGFHPGQSIRGFRALGPLAKPAIPELIRRLGDLRTQEWAFVSLCALGPGGIEAIKGAWDEIADANCRLNIMAKIEFYGRLAGTNAPDFTPVLLQCLTEDPIPPNRASAARALGASTARPDLVVPALAEALQVKDGLLRIATAEALGKFGTNAHAAIPALQQLIQDPREKDPAVPAAAAAALQLIDPE